MKKLVFNFTIAIFALSFTGCAMIPTKDSLMSYDTTTTVVVSELSSSVVPTFVVGGWDKNDMPLIDEFARKIGAIPILPKRQIPIAVAADVLYQQIVDKMEEMGLKGPIFCIFASWSGLPGRRFAAQHPELVMGIVTIGTPVGGYPEIVNRFLFGPEDDDCNIHLYLIAGYDETLSSSSKIWMTGDLNDGLLGLNNVTDVGKRKITAKKIFPNVRHLGLFKDPRVVQQVNSWISQEREIAQNKVPEKQPTLLGAVSK
jgi:hypothetical protein